MILGEDTWEWDGTTWTQVADTGPAARFGAAMTSTGAALLLFGGIVANRTVVGDTWQWSADQWTDLQDFGPAPRSGHGMIYDADRKNVVLYGGVQTTPDQGNETFFGDTWEAAEPAAAPAPAPGAVATRLTGLP